MKKKIRKQDSVLTDEGVGKKIQAGNAKLFSILVDRYESKMRRYAKRFLKNAYDIDDVLQEVFIKVYTNIQSFDVDKKFSSWLYRIARNTFLNHIRSSKKELFRIDFDTVLPFLYGSENPESLFEFKKLSGDIDASLEKLDQKYREVIILRFYEGLSYEEIADIVRIPVSTVGVRISRALKYMKGNMDIKL